MPLPTAPISTSRLTDEIEQRGGRLPPGSAEIAVVERDDQLVDLLGILDEVDLRLLDDRHQLLEAGCGALRGGPSATENMPV